MAEYWKSTPSYWCKFCSIYVKDTGLERKNHEASTKHQNNIQRNLRQLQKGQEQQQRDQQRAKNEVARLKASGDNKKNSAVSYSATNSTQPVLVSNRLTTGPSTSSALPNISPTAQRKAHAEQLAALGVKLPEHLQREVTGIGGWQVVSETFVPDAEPDAGASALIKDEDANSSDGNDKLNRKRKVNDDIEQTEPSGHRPWGTKLKIYPLQTQGSDDEELDSLLSDVKRKTKSEHSACDALTTNNIKSEQPQDEPSLSTIDHMKVSRDTTPSALPVALFKRKKRKTTTSLDGK